MAQAINYFLKSIVLFNFFLLITCDYFKNELDEDKVIWCTSTPEELKKCKNFAHAIPRDLYHFGSAAVKFDCKLASNKEECMTMLDEEKADLTTVDAGDVFIAGRYHSLVPIMREIYPGNMKHYYAVAVVKKGSLPDVHHIRDLRGKKACFANVGSHAGWVIPVHTLMNEGGMDIIDCNNHVKSAINFFGPSCAVNSLIDKYNPIGDNSDKLCQICIGRIPGDRCTPADPYAGFEGAFRCLIEAGEIAFLKHTTIHEMLDNDVHFVGLPKDRFELLCRDGSRMPVHEYALCNWGTVPTHAVLTTSAKSPEQRTMYQKFLLKAVEIYGIPYLNKTQYKTSYDSNHDNNNNNNNNRYNNSWENRFDDRNRNRERAYERVPIRDEAARWDVDADGNPQDLYNQDRDPYKHNDFYNNNQSDTKFFENFNLFESSPKYGIRHNLLFQDSTIDLESIEEIKQTYGGYLGKALDLILNVRRCPVNRMVLCVTSDPELQKCLKMKIALKAQLLKPEMICQKGHSQIHCMQSIRNGNADVTVLDAGDVYTAGLNYELIPFISEIYNLGEPEYYVVAVAKENDPSTELTFLKNKYTCHPGINTAAGWIVPLAFLISNGWIRSYGCDSVHAAAEYFTKACVPGALSTEYNTGVPYDNLCDLCHGASYRYCRRDASEDYYGHTGAFKCLVEGGGNVAFVKHTTVNENVDGKRTQWWARNTLLSDFELLCPDGTRKRLHDYRKCNLGKAKANAIVTRGGAGYNETELNAFINLFIYAQQFYGRKESDEFSFSMFYTAEPFTDLIFQDATLQLKIIPEHQRSYSAYLGRDFLRARRIVDCHAGANSFERLNIFLILVVALLPGYFITR